MIASLSAELLRFQLRLARPPLDDVAAGHMHRAIDFYVDELHMADWALDQVIVAVKRIASDAGFQPTTGVSDRTESLGATDQLLVDMVRWAADRYALNLRNDRPMPAGSRQHDSSGG